MSLTRFYKKLHIQSRLALTFCGTICLCMTFMSCNKPAKEIEEECTSGLVLIMNRSYYELALPNRESFYFTGVSSDGDLENLTMDPTEAVCVSSTGTGFFVSANGEIATNNHVVAPEEDIDDLERHSVRYVESIKNYYSLVYYNLSNIKDSLAQVINLKYNNNYNYSTDLSLYEEVEGKMESAAKLFNEFSRLNASNAKLIYHSEISIAYNNTAYRSYDEFEPCNVKKTSREHDVALIQLKSKKTPTDKYIFKVPENDPLEDYSLGDKLAGLFGGDKNETIYMNGFNHGLDLALTKEGIKSQFTSGNVSQKTKERIMYTIPALHGSSGSPVLNKRGELVAVNFAGLDVTQSFNYGVRIKYLRYLMK